VQGAKKDDLQLVIQKVQRDSPSGLRPAETSVSPRRVKEADLSDEVETSTLVEDFPVQFVNYQ
jgi:hypothetical protein